MIKLVMFLLGFIVGSMVTIWTLYNWATKNNKEK